MKIKFIILFLLLFTSVAFTNELNEASTKKISNTNIWLKTYSNYKNYNTVLNNINKTELEILKPKIRNNQSKLQEYMNKLNIYKSKLFLYEKKSSFDELLKNKKYEIPNINIYDYLFNISEEELRNKIRKYDSLKKEFYSAFVYLQDSYEEQLKVDSKGKRVIQLKEQIDYFSEYTENIEKMYETLLETKDDLKRKYEEYKNEVFIKHITTFSIIIVSYFIYKISLFIFFYLVRNKESEELEKNYRKLMALLFVLSILIFIIIRYINDIMYIITFLGIIAAALTIATREIILNIAGAIYIFFSNVIRVGDRVMVQFETKHTIGDITNISLIKIKLNEVSDYTNIKEIKNVGRTIYIPNSYIFTKVFYNYSLKKNGIINDLIEFEFDIDNNFDFIEEVTAKVFEKFDLIHTLSYSLNSTKTAIIAIISYQINYKTVSSKRGEISISLLKEYEKNENIKLKAAKKVIKKDSEE